MLSKKEKIDLITQIGLDINRVRDLDLLLERILTNARKFFNADAGSIYLKEGDHLRFSFTQNDTLQRRLGPKKKLIYATFTLPIGKQSIAGYVAKSCESVNIPDVYGMSNTMPYRWDPEFDKVSRYTTRSMLTVPLTTHRGDVLGVMQMINAQDDAGAVIPFSRGDGSLIMHFATSAALALERAQMNRNMILRMISMAELRDPSETGPHVNRVGAYSLEIYDQLVRTRSIPTEQVDHRRDVLRMAAMLHDVGKIAISDVILKKPAHLTAGEFQMVKRHTYKGARLFEEIHSDLEESAVEVALNHHERWDGTGYPGHIDLLTERALPGFEGPDGNPIPKREDEIPLFARIVAVADVYDVLSSRRCYKEPWDEGRILDELHRSSGTHFDPEIVNAFFSCLDVLKSTGERYPEVNRGESFSIDRALDLP
jgi:HD-GYP domain-containing protein (c-di-GMP phosphodiesterase class II)